MHSGKISRAVYYLKAEKPINYAAKDTLGVVNNVYYGGFDRAKYQGPLTTIKLPSYWYYEMPLGGLSIDGEMQEHISNHTLTPEEETRGTSTALLRGFLKSTGEKECFTMGLGSLRAGPNRF